MYFLNGTIAHSKVMQQHALFMLAQMRIQITPTKLDCDLRLHDFSLPHLPYHK